VASSRPVVLRNGVEVGQPLALALGFVEAYGSWDAADPAPPASFGEPHLRLANRGGARISAAEIAAILERRRSIEAALRAIAHDASLTPAANTVPWSPLGRLFGAFADIRGVGFSKMTKALHRKRPALIPILDSVVVGYLRDDDPGAASPFGERAVALVRGYKRDLDGNRAPLRRLRRELAGRGYSLTEVRILDVLIWSVEAGAAQPAAPAVALPTERRP
jgi:hypothetical protein